MTTRSQGQAAEELARTFLKKKGYKYLESNYRSRFGEIDLIMIDRAQLVFVEVKARTSITYGTPAEFITYYKLSKILKTVQFYLVQNSHYTDYRIDAVEVFLGDGNSINHIQNITQ